MWREAVLEIHQAGVLGVNVSPHLIQQPLLAVTVELSNSLVVAGPLTVVVVPG